MAKYKKADNCGPVPYPDGSGRFLGEGEVSDLDGWEPYVALGYVVKTGEDVAVTPDKMESPEELAKAVEPPRPPPKKEEPKKEEPKKAPSPPPPTKTVTEMAKEAAAKSEGQPGSAQTVAEAARSVAKGGRRKKKGTKSSDVSGEGEEE